MRVQPAKPKSLKFRRLGLRAAPFDRLGGPEQTRLVPSPIGDQASAQHNRQAAYALLAEECRSRVDALTPRQRSVLAGLIAGHSNKQIARILGISPRTIENYRAGLMDRLKARTLAQALHIAFVAGLTPTDTISLGAN